MRPSFVALAAAAFLALSSTQTQAQAQTVAQTPFPGVLGSPGLVAGWMASPMRSNSPADLIHDLAGSPEYESVGVVPTDIRLRSAKREPVAGHLTGYIAAKTAGVHGLEVSWRVLPQAGAGTSFDGMCSSRVEVVVVTMVKIAGSEIMGGGQGDGTRLSMCGASMTTVRGTFNLPKPGLYAIDIALAAAFDCTASRAGCAMAAPQAAAILSSVLQTSLAVQEPGSSDFVPAKPDRFWKEVWNQGAPPPAAAFLGSGGFSAHRGQ